MSTNRRELLWNGASGFASLLPSQSGRWRTLDGLKGDLVLKMPLLEDERRLPRVCHLAPLQLRYVTRCCDANQLCQYSRNKS